MTRVAEPYGDEPDDRTLLAAHVAGDPTAFGVLFGRHRDRLWAVALRTTGDPDEAADALQDALVSAFRRAGSYRGDAAVTTWLHRIVVNAALDRLRRRRTRAAEPLPDDLEDHADRGSLRTSAGTSSRDTEDPAETAVRIDQRRQVLAALATLPLDQRAALVLVDMEGHSVEEAAAILGVPSGTVKSRCSRGRARLLPLLRRNQDDDPDVPSLGRPTGDPAGDRTGDRTGDRGRGGGEHA